MGAVASSGRRRLLIRDRSATSSFEVLLPADDGASLQSHRLLKCWVAEPQNLTGDLYEQTLAAKVARFERPMLSDALVQDAALLHAASAMDRRITELLRKDWAMLRLSGVIGCVDVAMKMVLSSLLLLTFSSVGALTPKRSTSTASISSITALTPPERRATSSRRRVPRGRVENVGDSEQSPRPPKRYRHSLGRDSARLHRGGEPQGTDVHFAS